MTNDTRMIELTQGCSAIVDAADYEWLMQWKWCVNHHKHTTYAKRGAAGATVMMHRFILSATKGITVDHINHNGLDNRRANLRLATYSENLRNTRSVFGSSSKYLGVSFDKTRGKWRANIMLGGTKKQIGRFDREADAAAAYDEAAIRHYGAFANPNFPKDDH